MHLTMKYILTFICLLLCTLLPAQKKSLTHDDLVSWNRISNHQITHDGKYVVYRLIKDVGDPSIHVYNKKTGQTWSYPRAKRPSLSEDSQYVVFAIPLAEESVKALKRKKTKKKDMPKDCLLYTSPSPRDRG